MTYIDDNQPPLTEAQLLEFELQLGSRLPEDYRQFLLNHNGGTPQQTLFHIPDCNEDALVDVFLGIGRKHVDLVEWMKELRQDMKDKYVVIGFDPGGNKLLLKRSDGSILYWDSARFFSCSTNDTNAYVVAESFSKFLDALKPA